MIYHNERMCEVHFSVNRAKTIFWGNIWVIGTQRLGDLEQQTLSVI